MQMQTFHVLWIRFREFAFWKVSILFEFVLTDCWREVFRRQKTTKYKILRLNWRSWRLCMRYQKCYLCRVIHRFQSQSFKNSSTSFRSNIHPSIHPQDLTTAQSLQMDGALKNNTQDRPIILANEESRMTLHYQELVLSFLLFWKVLCGQRGPSGAYHQHFPWGTREDFICLLGLKISFTSVSNLTPGTLKTDTADRKTSEKNTFIRFHWYHQYYDLQLFKRFLKEYSGTFFF